MGLITDRTQRNVYRRKELSAKGWLGMSLAERAEWLGDPLKETGVNLLPCGPYYSSVVDLKYWNKEIIATTSAAGVYLYAISIIGEASNYENKTFTLSVEDVKSSANGVPQIALYWHDDNGYEYAGGSLLTKGSITVNTSEWPNTSGRAYLALYVYVTTSEGVPAGASATFVGVMFENGSTKHPYVPYVDVLPTQTTKGAYNYSDLNRVERAVAEISDRMGLGLVTKTNWTMWDVPKASDMERYLYNVEKVREICLNQTNLPLTPTSMSNLTYTDANNIELILSEGYVAATS